MSIDRHIHTNPHPIKDWELGVHTPYTRTPQFPSQSSPIFQQSATLVLPSESIGALRPLGKDALFLLTESKCMEFVDEKNALKITVICNKTIGAMFPLNMSSMHSQ